MAEVPFAVAVCTRNRSEFLHRTLDALEAQAGGAFSIVVVDQSDAPDERLAARAGERLHVLRDSEGRGLSRARNLASQALTAEWIAFVDDDCRPEPDWASELGAALTAHPEAWLVTGDVLDNAPGEDYLTVTAHPVKAERSFHGRWTRPWDIGVGVFMTVRRSAIETLGGWDERLGPGVEPFGAADDMDFNYRLLRAGGSAYATPRVRVVHDQWRSEEELIPLYHRYMLAWTGFALKHLRGGDIRGGLWLWSLGAADALRMLASSVRRRSWMRWRVALRKLHALAVGTVAGLRFDW